MGVTSSSGPTATFGPMASASGVSDASSPLYGPNLDYQGAALPDVRFPVPLANEQPGTVRAFLDSPYVLMTNALPAASAATAVNIAAAANVTSGTAMTLVSAPSAGITPNVPIYPFGSQTVTIAPLMIDMGFSTLNVTSGSPTATFVSGASFYYYPGQWLVIGNIGNAGATIPLIAQVLAVGATTLTLSTNALATNSAAPVGQGNILNPNAPSSATAWVPYVAAGYLGLLNPLDAVSRGIAITGVSGGSGGTFTVSGWDIYGQPMTQTVTVAAGASTGYSLKTFKAIKSVTPNFTDAHNYSVGTSDVFGFNLRADLWEALNVFVGGSYLSANTGWTAPDQTSPATAATGDVRGTIQVGARGPLGSGAAGGPISGSVRVAAYISMPVANLTNATPANPAPMFGVTQA